MLQPALVLPKALWQGGQGVALAEEPVQARQARQLVWKLRQGHAAHVQEFQLLQGADVARDLLDGVVAAQSTRLSAEGLKFGPLVQGKALSGAWAWASLLMSSTLDDAVR